MSKTASLLIGALLLVVLAAPAVAQKQTITGQLIDLACYWQNNQNTGNAHGAGRLNCGQACAREGFQVGLVTTAGKVYQVNGDLAADKNAKLAPHIGQTVTIAGEVTEQDGMSRIAASDLTVVKR